MDERELNRRVQSRAGLRNTAETARAIRAALGALRCAMDEAQAVALSRALPPRYARLLERTPAVEARTAKDLYVQAQQREGAALGFAMEHVQSVLEVLAMTLDPELVARLRGDLPPEIGALLRGSDVFDEPPPVVHTHPATREAARETLSRARPGTGDPIAEARHALAHAGSVARGEAAHAERMVETARSTRPGREDETMATGRDRPGRR